MPASGPDRELELASVRTAAIWRAFCLSPVHVRFWFLCDSFRLRLFYFQRSSAWLQHVGVWFRPPVRFPPSSWPSLRRRVPSSWLPLRRAIPSSWLRLRRALLFSSPGRPRAVRPAWPWLPRSWLWLRRCSSVLLRLLPFFWLLSPAAILDFWPFRRLLLFSVRPLLRCLRYLRSTRRSLFRGRVTPCCAIRGEAAAASERGGTGHRDEACKRSPC